MWYIYTVEYYSAIKRNEIGSFADTWMGLETVIQSEVSQDEKKLLIHVCGICSYKAELEIQMQKTNG